MNRRHRLFFRRGLLLATIPSMLVGGAVYWKTALTPDPPTVQLGSEASLYTVVPGDSLSAIAARYGVSASAIIAVNGITNPDLVVIGARLRIPAASAPSGLPNDRRAVQQLISSYAQMYSIPPAFALAIAWEESGFNQNMVSQTGALGVMQVEPDTGVTVADLLGRPFNLHIVRDNVQAGVYWLARLDASYSGDQRLAAAAYYQGAGSVSRDGLYRDTLQYVSNVMALEARFGG
jgi:soluble lytic murein transglycosylase-like protein